VDANLTRAEAILMIQAQALEALYHQLAQRAIKAEYLHYLPGSLLTAATVASKLFGERTIACAASRLLPGDW
jgi:hypothetical protein